MAEFEFDGRSVAVIPPRELTLGDLAFIKKEYDIDSQVLLEEGLAMVDPVAWRALLTASIRRGQPEVSATDGRLDDVAIVPLMEAMTAEREAALLKMEAEQQGGGDRPTGGSSSTPAKRGARK